MTLAGFAFPSRVANLDGLAYAYVDEGQGHPVVFLHGNPTWSYFYRDLIAAVAGRWRALAPDHIGMGRSAKPPRARYPYTLARRVADLARFLDMVVGDRPVTLVMHDWGGMIGGAWATRQPERVAGLVLLNTAAFPLPAGKRLPAPLRLARTPGLGTVAVRGCNAFARGAARYGSAHGPLPPPVRRGYLAPYGSWAARVGIHQFVRDIPTGPGHPTYPLVAQTDAGLHRLRGIPTLICWGERDPVFDPDYLAAWRARLPAAEVHIFPEAGHYVLEDAGAAVSGLVTGFLERTTAAPGVA